MSRVDVKEPVLQWALKRANLTAEGLQKKYPKIQEWITGESNPTLRQLDSLAKTTKTPLGFLFLNEPPEIQLPIPHFRTVGDEAPDPSPDILETIQVMQQRQSWMHDFLVEQGHEPLSFVHSANIQEPTPVVAKRIRDTLNLGEGWASKQATWTNALRAIRDAMEEVGILVVANGIVGNNTRRQLDPSEFRGFVLVDEYAPLVFVNNADGKAAQMFTLAHELAHVFFGSSAAFDLREMQPASDPTEQACNRVAAEFLIPEQELQELWPSIQGDSEPLQTLARRYKVSVLVAARRALDLQLITKQAFFEFYQRYQNDERRTAARQTDGGDFYANQNLRVGKRFASAVMRAAKEGKLLYTEAYRLTGLHGKTFHKYAEELGFGGV